MDKTTIDTLFGQETGRTILGIFDMMEIAEAEISAAMKRHPAKEEILWDSFRMLGQGLEQLNGKQAVARGHFRELLERVANDEDTRPPTAAEMLVALSETSLQAPLNHPPTLVYARLFRDFFENVPPEVTRALTNLSGLVSEEEVNDVMETMRRKLTVPGRVNNGA